MILNKEDALTAISNSQDYDIFILGDEKNVINQNLFEFKKIDNSEKINSNKKFKSVWITEEKSAELLSENKVNNLKDLLINGYSVYFLGISDNNILNKLLLNNNSTDELKNSNLKQQAIFVTRNNIGEYFIGHIYSENNYSDDNVLKTILASTWNRRNDSIYTRKIKVKLFLNSISKDVYASNGSSYSIGSSWSCVYGWSQYTINTTYGDYTEWKAAFYLTDPVDGKDYYSMAIEGAMDPQDGYRWSNRLNYYSTANGNGQDNLLRSYAPTSSPSSYTYSFSIGGSLSEEGDVGGNIGASWGTSYSDLSLNDSSQPSIQRMNLYFNYNISSYSNNTSWQNTSFIYQAPVGSTYCKLDNGREAKFIAGQAPNFVYSNGTLNYCTTVYK